MKVIDKINNCELEIEVIDTRDTANTDYVHDVPEELHIFPGDEEYFPVLCPDGDLWGYGRFSNGKLEI